MTRQQILDSIAHAQEALALYPHPGPTKRLQGYIENLQAALRTAS